MRMILIKIYFQQIPYDVITVCMILTRYKNKNIHVTSHQNIFGTMLSELQEAVKYRKSHFIISNVSNFSLRDLVYVKKMKSPW